MAGAIFGTALFPKLYKRTRASAKQGEGRLNPNEASRSELQSLEFEKSLLYQLTTRVFEAVHEGKIDEMERDRLLQKYKRQLAIYNEKIDTLRPLVDFSDLSIMRDDVVNLLEKRITAIDEKLAELSKKYNISHTGLFSSKTKTRMQSSPPIIEMGTWQQEQEQREARRRREVKTETQSVSEHNEVDDYPRHIQYATEEGDWNNSRKKNILSTAEQESGYISEEKNIEKLHEEIMVALSRLEQAGTNDMEDQLDDGHKLNDKNGNKDKKSASSQYIGFTSSLGDRSCLRQLR